MKKTAILFWTIFIFPFIGYTQPIEDLDYISPFKDGLAAIKKANQWAFINTDGAIIVNFRDDIESLNTNKDYPTFNNNRCLITIKKDGISYFGFIDKSGKTVIEPQFLNATNFENGVAFALALEKQELGKNDVLGKTMVSYDYLEVIINTKGEILHDLSKPNHIILSKKHIKAPPVITSKFISDNLVATMNTDKKWVIQKIK